MKKLFSIVLLMFVVLFSCKTKSAEGDLAAADDMRQQAVEAQEKALTVGADRFASELYQQGVKALKEGDSAAASGDYALALEKFAKARDLFTQAYDAAVAAGGSRYAEALAALRRAEAAITENDDAIQAGKEEKAELDAAIKEAQQ